MFEFFSSFTNAISSLFAKPEQFHFLRPEWFYLLLGLAFFWWLKLNNTGKTQWHQILPPHLSNALLGQNQQTLKQNKWLIPILWLIAITALAGPTWQKIEKPVYQIKRASVIVMDMSMSMRATDMKPNRLTKARFKAIDLAKNITDGEIALVAYAGDAFTISPLTPDNRNIVALIPSLSPEIMPEQGSVAVLGLTAAANLLKQAGYMTGDIYWLTDGVEQYDVDEINEFISNHQYKINIMAFGSKDGAPIKMLDNSLLKDGRGSIVIPKLNASQLAQFSNISNGVYVQSTPSDLDIKTLTAAQASPEQQDANQSGQDQQEQSLTGDDWQEFGPTLILLILPFVLLAFRKGVVLSVLLIAPLLSHNPPVYANSLPVNKQQLNGSQPTSETQTAIPDHSWTDFIFNTKDQVANKAFEQGDYSKAQHTFEQPQWKGSAAYKAGDYEAAYQHFSQDSSAQGLYNQGNALANLNKLDEAIETYEQALKLDPNHNKAQENKELLEKLKQQQESQQQQNSDQQEGQQNQKDQQGGQSQESEQDSEQQNSEQQSDQQQSSDQSSEQNGEEQQQASEPTGSPNQESSDSEQDNQQQAEQQPSGEQKDEQNKEQMAQQQSGQLTEEELAEQENQQKLQQLLRKVSDDPSVLLRNKMILESRKRQQQRSVPKGATKSW
ncbi:MAG: VWA domain-containing protein [Gammaproteobacteria bacterium]|nr:VWA domain-containing protein [Gammaproteobacteria bacterium]